MPRVNVVLSCTNRKRFAVPDSLRLRTVGGGDVAARAERWCERVKSSTERPVAARDLYSGDHWYVGRQLPNEGIEVGLTLVLWICSAGYGLVRGSSKLKPYSATFSPDNADAVRRLNGKLVDDALLDRQWWRALSRNSSRRLGSLEALAQAEPTTPLLVAVSPRYLNAMAIDLKAAARALDAPDLLTIFSSGGKQATGVEDHVVRCDARLQHELGGARFSLNARALRLAIRRHRRWGLGAHSLKEQFAKLLERQPPLDRFERERLRDAEVCSFIERRLRNDPGATKTKLLREFRASNCACEQSRFGALFDSVREEVVRASA